MNPRSSVKQFAQAMERKLRENDHKGGWMDSTTGYLVGQINAERRELLGALQSGDPERIVDECADVANFAMMIADKARKDRL